MFVLQLRLCCVSVSHKFTALTTLIEITLNSKMHFRNEKGHDVLLPLAKCCVFVFWQFFHCHNVCYKFHKSHSCVSPQ